jgi:hypothetical protein
MPTIIETFPEFAERHGGRSSAVLVDNNSWLFPDGATYNSGPFGSRREPPSDPDTLLAVRLQYVRRKLDLEEEAFLKFQSDCRFQAHWAKANPSSCAPPPPNAGEQLRAGKKRIAALRKELKALDQQYAKTQGAIVARERQEQASAARHRIDDQLREIDSVSLEN